MTGLRRYMIISDLLMVAMLLLLACGLRLRVAGDVLWVDELHTSWCVAGELQQVAPRAVQGNQSPLYFWLVWFVVQVTGQNALGLRAISLLASAGSVAVAGWLAWFYTRSRPAVFVLMLLAAVDLDFIFYATEARPYAVVQFVSLLHVLALSALLGRAPSEDKIASPLRVAAFAAMTALTGIAMFYLHYTAALLLVGEAVAVSVLLLCAMADARQRWAALLTVGVVVAGGCALSAPQLLDIASRRTNWAMFIPYARPFAAVEILHVPLYAGIAAAIALPAFCLRCTPARWRPQKLRWLFSQVAGTGPTVPAAWWVIAVCWLVVPLALAYGCNNFDIARLWHYRYLLVVAAAPMVLGCLLCASAGSTFLQWTAALVVAAGGVYFNFPEPYKPAPAGGGYYLRNENWREAVQLVNHSRHNRKQPVLLYSGLIEADALLHDADNHALHAYTLFPLNGIYRLQHKHAVQSLATSKMGELPRNALRQLAAAGGCWLIVRGPPVTGDQVTGGVMAYLGGAAKWRIASRNYVGGVTVVRLEIIRKQ